ncbi:hypothetical protein [Robbsia andropogonis]|uniref:hypothetical protein n=1 Tax=Robbsia andropogonis TaxID=28092 RepID=UPI000465E5F0|nr:hypothetical protein [Robbsia andropogonis]
MQRVVVVVNNEVYANLFAHSSGMAYIHTLEDAIQNQFAQHGIAVKIVESNSTDLSNGVGQAVVQIKPTHILRLAAVVETTHYDSCNLSLVSTMNLRCRTGRSECDDGGFDRTRWPTQTCVHFYLSRTILRPGMRTHYPSAQHAAIVHEQAD